MKTKYIFLFLWLFVSCASTYNINNKKSWIDLGSISYGTDKDQFVEVTVPENNNYNMNLIVFIHGYRNKMIDLTFIEKYREDFIIGNLNFRHLTPKRAELSMNELLSDVHDGLNAIKDNVEEKGIKIDKVILIGHSLGAALALMYSNTFFDRYSIPIAFCVTLAGLTNMTDAAIAQFIKNLGDGIIQNYVLSIYSIFTEVKLSSSDITELGFSDITFESLKNISPIQFVNENTPPIIIVHDTNDRIIPFSNAVSLDHVLNAYNIPHIFIQSVTNSGHYLKINDTVFEQTITHSPARTPKRSVRKLHPLLEEKLIEAINQYISEFCRLSLP